MLHEAFIRPTLDLARCSLFAILTNFPKSSTELLVSVEAAGELVAMVKDLHQLQQLFRRDSAVDVLIVKKLVRGFNEQEL